jgi:hypothetical protein
MSAADLTKLSAEERHQLVSVPINGQGLKTLLEAGMTWLKTNQQVVNSLNVFPVPDGDTGTNMVLTMQAAFDEVENSGIDNVGELGHAIARGALMGARGNSGVILSQIWRGFARALDSEETMDVHLLAKALNEAKETAYKGVVRPVEGTILTVIKGQPYSPMCWGTLWKPPKHLLNAHRNSCQSSNRPAWWIQAVRACSAFLKVCGVSSTVTLSIKP